MAASFPSTSSFLQPHAQRVDGSPTPRTSTSNGAERPANGIDEQNSLTHEQNNLIHRSNKINVPTVPARPKDIICGRGLHIMNREGNLNLHVLVSKFHKTYISSTRRDKAAITEHIVQELKSTGARFLRRFDEDKNSDRWVEVDDKTAYKKVGHALRLRKNDHGRNFLKSIEKQKPVKSDIITKARAAVAPPPVEATVTPSLPQNGSGDGLSLSSSTMLGSRLPHPPLPESQLGSVAIHAPSLLAYARLQSLAQPTLQVSPLYTDVVANAALDRLLARDNLARNTLMATKLAILTRNTLEKIDRNLDSV